MEVLRQTERPGRTTRTLRSLDQLRSELERVRSGGYATTVDEIEIGVSSLAAPVFGPTGRAIAALNVVFPTSNGKLERRVDTLVPVVVGAARDLSGQLGWREPAGRDQNFDSQRISRADES
jgi:DNA-binding IclR family transcriptional regulator